MLLSAPCWWKAPVLSCLDWRMPVFRSCFDRCVIRQRLVILAILLLLPPALIQAQTNWTGSVSSDWFNPSNWDAGLPTAGVDARLNGGPNALMISQTSAARSLTLGSDLPSNLTIIGGGDLITSEDSVIGELAGTSRLSMGGFLASWRGDGTLTVGKAGNGELTVGEGSFLQSGRLGGGPGAVVAEEATSDSTVNVTGDSTVWQSIGGLTLGLRGSAVLNINTGGQVNSDEGTSSAAVELGSQAIINLSNIGSWQTDNLNLGVGGSADLNISGLAARAFVLSDLNAAVEAGSTARIRLSGGGSVGARNFMVLGDLGSSHLDIEGGTAGGGVNTKIVLARGVGSTSDVRCFSGNMFAESIEMGAGLATIDVQDGGLVSASQCVAVSKTGQVHVSGKGSTLSTNELRSEGFLQVTDEGKISSRTGKVVSSLGGESKVLINGEKSIWTNQDRIELGGEGISEIEVTGRGRVFAPVTVMNPGDSGESIVTVKNGIWQSNTSFQLLHGRNSVSVLEGGYLSSRFQVQGGESQVVVSGDGSRIDSVPSNFNESSVTYLVKKGGYFDGYQTYLGGKTSSLLVDGPGSTYRANELSIESSLSSEILVQNGGRLATNIAELGTFSNAGSIEFRIDGVGSIWEVETLFLQNSAATQVIVSNGATIQSGGASINKSTLAEASIRVAGLGSSWTNRSQISIGAGSLFIEDGGAVTSDGASIGISSGPSRVVINGQGSSWISSDTVRLGFFGDCVIDITNGGYMRAPILLMAGTVQIDGGKLESPRIILFGGTTENNGTIIGDVFVARGGLLSGSGIFDGTVNLSSGGIFSPGNSPGEATTPMTNWGAGGIYQWEINALETGGGLEGNPVGWDLWNTGDLSIDGLFTIELTTLNPEGDAGLLSGWNPARSHLWRIATADNGAFADLGNLQLGTSKFANDLAGGTFALRTSADGNELFVRFSAIPEASSMILVGLAALVGVGLVSLRPTHGGSSK